MLSEVTLEAIFGDIVDVSSIVFLYAKLATEDLSPAIYGNYIILSSELTNYAQYIVKVVSGLIPLVYL